MTRYTPIITAKDLDFDVTEQLRRMVSWEVWDKMARDTLNSIANLNPVQIDTYVIT